MSNNYSFWVALFCLVVLVSKDVEGGDPGGPIPAKDADKIQFALNLEFFEAEFFCNGATGRGLDGIAPGFAKGGPPPIGAQRANLDNLTRQIFEEFCYQEVGHLRAIITAYGGFPRPLYDLSNQSFATVFDKAVGYKLIPPFDPYASSVQYLLASYVIPYVGLVGYVGTIPELADSNARRLVSGLLAVEAGQDAVIRSLLYEIADKKVEPYNVTVAEFTDLISGLRNKLAATGNKDEGLTVPKELGAEKKIESNILSADANSVSYSRTPMEILRVVYGSGNESQAGGFLPRGGNGRIARSFLDKNIN
ncbi:hypothetical protein JCGZ_24105 [Jatropha curcas]|uniref:Desiccation-related protein PCC13-62 n=1 Tax=Jatropha curcas TaxID=180498 RepID=A0A067LEJ6_JATCU|nr:desiccation-related protein PCC13-62 [Jatropha curcas]KDP46896.1 hypothetical protein JCGZ_24105 [Jatropha curcas]